MFKLINLLYKNFYIIVLLLVTASCVDERILEDKGESGVIDGDKSYLEFTINLSSLTRDASAASSEIASFEKYEDYIDPNNIYILFYYADENDPNTYDTLIQAFSTKDERDNLTFIPIESSTDKTTKEWYIRIPVEDFDGDFATAIRTKDFKIAVLANWSWENVDISDGFYNFEKDSHIKLLHHITALNKEPYYDHDENKEEEGDRTNLYGFLYDNYRGAMGDFQDWVINGFRNKDIALSHIEDNYSPGEDLDINGITYRDLRFLYNFAEISKENSGYDFSDKSIKKWLSNNKLGDLGDITKKAGPLSFSVYKGDEDTKKAYVTKSDSYVAGVVLPVGKYEVSYTGSGENKTTNYIAENVFKLNLQASGKLRITWGSLDASNAKLTIDHRNNIDDTTVKDSNSAETSDKKTSTFDYGIDSATEYVYIYCSQGTAVIYEIDYVEDDHLYQSNRLGKKLGMGTNEVLIPMYGIQKFGKLNDVWKEGSVFGLSNFNKITPSYDTKKISMLRSVAKVELKLPMSADESPYHHVFLRVLNRTGRSEPVDVSTPTDEIWKDHIASTTGDHSKECEWFTLRNFAENNGLFYKNAKPYREMLAWYYGNWADANGKLGEIQKAINSESPHIMNPMINRSDYAQFIYTGDDGMYRRYVLYVPEKFIDDPNNISQKTQNNKKVDRDYAAENPKVCHIEFRVKNDNFLNLDDNNHYRIYFIEGGYNTELNNKYIPKFTETKDGSTNQTWENMYEQEIDNLKKHWPILRNHVYSFTVTDDNSRVLVVNLKVLPWKEVDQNIYEW